jgi:hypothetical protein
VAATRLPTAHRRLHFHVEVAMNSSGHFIFQVSMAILIIAVSSVIQFIGFFGNTFAQMQTNMFKSQFWQSVATASNSQLTFCSNVSKHNVRRRSMVEKILQEQVWSDSNFPVAWQFCTLTPLRFETWKFGWEKALRLKVSKNFSIKTYPQPWRNWAYCGSCAVQMYVVQQQQTKQEFLIEFYPFWENKDDMVVSRQIPGGFIRVARFR